MRVLCQQRANLITVTSSQISISGSVNRPTCSSFSKLFLVILDPLHFHVNFKISFPFSEKKLKGTLNFNKDWAEPVNQFGDYCHLSNIKSSNPEHGMSFRLFRFILISFMKFCSFQGTNLALNFLKVLLSILFFLMLL